MRRIFFNYHGEILSRLLLLLAVCCVPYLVSADVSINEVAWMGSTESANDEWIELYNAGENVVDLTGWKLEANDESPSIELSGTISAGGFFMLERTDDDSAPGVLADVIFVGSLANSGEVLKLLDESGATIDRVDGADEWGIGGNNETKDTLQRVGGVWSTAVPTPGRTNSTVATNLPEKKTTTKKSARQGGSIIYGSEKQNDKMRLVDREKEFSFSIGEDRIVTTKVPEQFEVVVQDERGKDVNGVHALWNFGDGTTGEGTTISHTYQYPGEYVVQAEVQWRRFEKSYTEKQRIIVSAQTANVVVTDITDEYLTLYNSEDREIDLSGWKLFVLDTIFEVPGGTIILPATTLTLPREVTGLRRPDTQKVVMFYPGGNLAQAPEESEHANIPPQRVSQQVVPAAPVVADPVAPVPELPYPYGTASVPDTSSQVANVAHALPRDPSESGSDQALWWLALIGLVGTACALVLFGRTQPTPQSGLTEASSGQELRAEDFTIVSDNEANNKL